MLVDGWPVSVMDRDEARADVPASDLDGLTRTLRRLRGSGGRSTQEIQDALDAAALAWKTATCWSVEPAYAPSLPDPAAAESDDVPVSHPLGGIT